MDVDGGAPTRVTTGDFDHTSVDWSPTGALLAFTAARHPDAGNDLRCDVWVCHPDGSDLRALTQGGFEAASARFSSDGRLVCFTSVPLAASDQFPAGRNIGVWAVPVTGSAPARRLTHPQAHTLPRSGGMIATTANGVLFTEEYQGAVRLLAVPYHGGEPTVLVDGPRQVTGVATAGDTTAVTVTDPTTPGELAVVAGSGLRVLTCLGDSFAAEVDVRPMVEVTGTAPDGYPVHGWVVRPAGQGPHPVLLMIHGGPFAQYG